MAIRVRDILGKAFRVIGTDGISYRFNNGISANEMGIPQASFTEWQNARASVQPGIVSSFGGKNISEKEYNDLGLSWSRSYITIWIKDIKLRTAEDENAADQVMWNGDIYNVLQCADWIDQATWKRCYCVKDRDRSDNGK